MPGQKCSGISCCLCWISRVFLLYLVQRKESKREADGVKEDVAARLTAKDDQCACAYADQIIAQSRESDCWYACFDEVAALLDHPKSLVRNRALHILAANARWDTENRFDAILPDFLAHVTDDKPITARQCIKALAQVGLARPQHIPQILSCLQHADLSRYRDSMRPLIQKDMAETERILTADKSRD